MICLYSFGILILLLPQKLVTSSMVNLAELTFVEARDNAALVLKSAQCESHEESFAYGVLIDQNILKVTDNNIILIPRERRFSGTHL